MSTPGLRGKLAPVFPTGLQDLTCYSGPLPTPPVSSTRYRAVTAWPMDGNDQWGDCVCAAREHVIRLNNAIDPVAKTADPDAAAVVAGYEKLSGATTPPGPGLVVSSSLEAWRQGRFSDTNVGGPYAPVAVHDVTTLKTAVYLYGAVICGVDLPSIAETQFSNDQPWTLEPGQNPGTGGHCIPIVGYDPQWLYVVTWGKIQAVSYNWWKFYADEAWAVVPPGAPGPVDVATLTADLNKLAA